VLTGIPDIPQHQKRHGFFGLAQNISEDLRQLPQPIKQLLYHIDNNLMQWYSNSLFRGVTLRLNCDSVVSGLRTPLSGSEAVLPILFLFSFDRGKEQRASELTQNAYLVCRPRKYPSQ
jgi:hypothetical protein